MAVSQQERARRNRASILRSAALEFDRNGYVGSSLDVILDGSGVTKGSFYQHFPSKELLAVAIVDAMHARWAAAVRRWAESEHDALHIVLGLVDDLTVHCAADVVVRAGLRLTSEHQLVDAELLAPYPEWERLFRHLLHRAALTGLLRPGVDPASTAHLLVAGMVGERIVSGAPADPERVRARLDQLVSLLVPTVACDEWLRTWRASGWTHRTLPELAPPTI